LFVRHRTRKWLYERAFEWRNLNQAAALHFTTTEERALTQPLGLKAPGVVIPLGLHLQEYSGAERPGAFRRAYPGTQGKKIILFLGRLNFKKGLDLLAQAFGPIGRQRDDVHLVLAGPDNEGYANQVREQLQTEGLVAQCTFTGMLLGDKKLAAFRDADVFVLPSYTENFGIAVVEAMACGLPVVISDKVNIWQDVKKARAGYVVECDAQAVGAALSAILDDPEQGKAMGQRGRRLVAERFTWEKIGAQMRQLYRQVAEQARLCPQKQHGPCP
jgi:glycosyltransferase involved in cell wall biosynthesis